MYGRAGGTAGQRDSGMLTEQAAVPLPCLLCPGVHLQHPGQVPRTPEKGRGAGKGSGEGDKAIPQARAPGTRSAHHPEGGRAGRAVGAAAQDRTFGDLPQQSEGALGSCRCVVYKYVLYLGKCRSIYQ